MPLYPVAERSEHFGRVGEVEALGFSFRKLVQLTAGAHSMSGVTSLLAE
jgi:hypothetical protein